MGITEEYLKFNIKCALEETKSNAFFYDIYPQIARKIIPEDELYILRMFTLSAKEIAGTPDDILSDFSIASLVSCSQTKPTNNIRNIYIRIWKGGMPDMVGMDIGAFV